MTKLITDLREFDQVILVKKRDKSYRLYNAKTDKNKAQHYSTPLIIMYYPKTGNWVLRVITVENKELVSFTANISQNSLIETDKK